MTTATLILRSLRHHARAHLGVLLGAVVGSAVLVGALLVGDSVRGSLRELALARLGRTELAIASNDRLFRDQLAADLQPALSVPVAPGLLLPGTASSDGGAARANHVQVLGVEAWFWQLAGQAPPFTTISDERVVLNQPLAEQLRVKAGDTVVLRVPKPSHLSRDAPMAPEEEATVALRVTVQAVVSDAAFGRFSLQANQVAPYNAFVSLAWLQAKLNAQGRANLLLVGRGPEVNMERATAVLREKWQLADAELEVRELPEAKTVELRTKRVFIEKSIMMTAFSTLPGASGVLTYFVNELQAGDRQTPYSMVAALGPPLIPMEMADDEIILNQWLADDLGAKPGDLLKMTYYVVGTARNLQERSQTFRVRAIVPMEHLATAGSLMPDFPGLTDAKNCREWNTGFPIDLERIREKDNRYWEDYRGTPKAFITMSAGQRLWANRFGLLTAIRFPLGESSSAQVAGRLREALNPDLAGLVFQPVRAQALAAVSQAQDFGGLFLGFSFFLIVAALLLMAMLFQFGVEQRATEVGTLLALGFTPRMLRRLLWWEGAALALLGGLVGLLAGAGYARAMLHGLATVWRDAVSTSALRFHATGQTLAVGALAAVLVGGLTIWLALRKQARQSARELLAEGAGHEPPGAGARSPARRRSIGITTGAALGALSLVAWAIQRGDTAAAGVFFGAGALLLVAAIGSTSLLLDGLNRFVTRARPTLNGLGWRNAARRRKRSVATVSMLACGSFLVVAVGANRLDATRDAGKRSSGAGGFALIGESTLPVVHDLNSKAGREFFGLEEEALKHVRFVPLRVRAGDDASCLNLNRAQQPRLLGVDAEALASRNAFTFARLADGFETPDPWLMLNRSQRLSPGSKVPRVGWRLRIEDDSVPAIADQASILWAMGKKVGDLIPYVDEKGQTFNIRLVGALANSVLQGNLVIAESEFLQRFPGESGYRMFLIDAPAREISKISALLTRGLQDVGLELTPASRRLAAFNAVQNTYLSTFQALGGLGLLLGSVGLGVVVLRNVLERRGELALLLAVGFPPRSVRWLVVSEHGALLLLGLAGGVIAAVVAVMPALLSPGAEVPYGSLSLTLMAVLVSGAAWTWAAAGLALRGNLLDALRNN